MSTTVKRVDFIVPEYGRAAANFLPGQWLDVEFDGIDTIGGFSLCSDPSDAQRTDGKAFVSIAVKIAKHPPARHVHESLMEGDKV